MADKHVIRDVVKQVIVLAHKEDVQPLLAAFEQERLPASVQRIQYTDEEQTFARNSRVLLNHRLAWERATQLPGYTIICESDFVPCRGLGDFPIFWPEANSQAWGYLYQGTPRLLALLETEPYLRAHANPLVAYVVNATVARILLDYFEHVSTTYDLSQYFTFDMMIQWYVMGKGAAAFMPRRHYGEHGGLPNKEHQYIGKLRQGGEHRADNLMGRLHFLPQYAHGSALRFLFVRSQWHLLGIAKLLAGRWIAKTNVYDLSFGDKCQMFLVGLERLAPRFPGFGR